MKLNRTSGLVSVLSATRRTSRIAFAALLALSMSLLHATPAEAAPIDTINNPMNVNVDLFDYWITGQYDNENQNNVDAANATDRGINAGHTLLFHKNHPNYGAEQFTGMTNPMLYWGPVVPGIVQPTLGDDGYPKLPDSNAQNVRVQHMDGNGNVSNTTYGSMFASNPNGESLAYLFQPGHAQEGNGRKSYTGVEGLFKVNDQGYYVYDSADNAARYSDGRFIVDGNKDTANGVNGGFWPFGTGNNRHYLGLHMNMSFSMPAGGQVLNPQGAYNDMTFSFAGDDDVWIFVDGVLIGDLGGIHQPSSIDINFATGDIVINGNTTSSFNRTTGPTRPEYIKTTIKEMWQASGQPDPRDGWKGYTFADGSYHKLDFFYIERGNGDSNLEITFNMINTGDFTAHKALVANPSQALRRNDFQFELVGLNGKYMRDAGTGEVTLVDASAAALMPKGASSHTDPNATPGPGDVSRYFQDRNENQPYWIYRVGNTEDGNVNFGNADFDNHSLGETYRYQIREVSAADGEVDKDERIYYMEATVAYDSVLKESYLSKRYYTDDTYTTLADDVSFANFVNLKGNVPSATPTIPVSKNLKQGDTAMPIAEGQFSFELLNSSGGVVATTTCGASGNDANKTATGTLTLPRLTPVDFNGVSGTITRTYTVRETIPDGASDNGDGTYTLNGVRYDKHAYTATLTATYDGNDIAAVFAYKDGEESVDAIAFHNTVEPVSASILKTWNDAAAGNGVTLAHPEATFRVVRSDETEVDNDGHKLAAPLALNSQSRAEDRAIPEDPEGDDNDEARTVTWLGLPRLDAEGHPITYEVIEVGTVPGYTAGSVSLIEEPGDGAATFAYTAQNTLRPLTLQLTKLAGPAGAAHDDLVALQGAGFTMTRLDPASNPPEPYAPGHDLYFSQVVETGEDGKATFGDDAEHPLYAGTYRISETTVPAGYQKAGDIDVVIAADGTATVSGKRVDYDAATRTLSIEITDTELPPLPSTGGPGDHLLIVSSTAMFVAAMALIAFVERRRLEA